MMWLIDTAGGAHNWALIARLYPSADNREVIIETDQYRTILCRCADAWATIKKIIEHGQLNDDLDVSTLDGVETCDRSPHVCDSRGCRHPDDAMGALALVAGMEPWRYHLAETEDVPKGDPEIFVIDRMPRGGDPPPAWDRE